MLVSGRHCLSACAPTASKTSRDGACPWTSAVTPETSRGFAPSAPTTTRALASVPSGARVPATATESIGKSIAARGRSFW
jgi:hypothetical protein